MLYLLSPAKALDYDTPIHPAIAARATRPAFVPQAAALIDVMKTKAPAEVAALMDLSPPLAALNVARYGRWRKTHTGHNSRPAVLAFDGDVYGGLQARTLDGPALDWAQAQGEEPDTEDQDRIAYQGRPGHHGGEAESQEQHPCGGTSAARPHRRGDLLEHWRYWFDAGEKA